MIAWAGHVPRAMPAVTRDIVSSDAQGRALVWLLRCGRAAAQSWASLAWDGREHDLYLSDDFEGGILVICIGVDFEGGIVANISFFLVVCIKFGFDDGDIFKHIVDEAVKGGSCAKPGLADPVRRARGG